MHSGIPAIDRHISLWGKVETEETLNSGWKTAFLAFLEFQTFNLTFYLSGILKSIAPAQISQQLLNLIGLNLRTLWRILN